MPIPTKYLLSPNHLLLKKININFGTIKRKKERVAPLCLFSQRNNPYCDLLKNLLQI